ncbi:hypothetical protein [uncultured Bradyrhizobium sp.]|uniref:hypothetical protein n=1 Tax=uncultured Bradyrhizobium sp. TaxID=199684 RepID=UPI00261C860F|nr:hypothetical protein [uncultured Bradyrhizobium sp.]
MSLFQTARTIAVREDNAPAPPDYGFEANYRSLQLAFEFSAEQFLTGSICKPEDLFLRS